MASLTHIEPATRYSEAVVHGNTVYLAGQVADDTSVGIEEQTKQTLAAIDRVLALAGTDKSYLLQATIYLRDMSDYAAMNSVWDAWIAPHKPPGRACVQALMARPEFRVEVLAIAAIPSK
eukprot:m.238168 g.238168  ORF g.238168 m.238168 type:complete len:120 (+) comp13261_c0_seq1:40-399(+)